MKDLEPRCRTRGGCKAARGRAIKVVSSLLKELPAGNNYQVLFMRRDLEEVLASQRKMLERRGESSDTPDAQMLEHYRNHLEKVEIMLRLRPEFEVLYLDYRSVIDSPRDEAERIDRFLGRQPRRRGDGCGGRGPAVPQPGVRGARRWRRSGSSRGIGGEGLRGTPLRPRL